MRGGVDERGCVGDSGMSAPAYKVLGESRNSYHGGSGVWTSGKS